MTGDPETDADKKTAFPDFRSINIGDLNWIGRLLLLAIVPMTFALAFLLFNWFQFLLPNHFGKDAALLLAIVIGIISLLVLFAVSYLLAHFNISTFKKRS
tara:strand:+ start:421 stop:720 length:300 start_codon:yes stop_codon:yes gene_type:complete